MKKEFIQQLANISLEKRVFASFPELKGELDEKKIAQIRQKLMEQPIFKIAKETGQDVNEIKEIILTAVDNATIKMRNQISDVFEKVLLPEFEKK